MPYELIDPKSPLTKAEELVFGVDAVRHPLLGIPIGHGSGPPVEQARNWLRSIRDSGAVTQEEFQDLARKLISWENAGNTVDLGRPILPIEHGRQLPLKPAPAAKHDPYEAFHLRPHEMKEPADQMDKDHPPQSHAKH
jgi:hypothetical protein